MGCRSSRQKQEEVSFLIEIFNMLPNDTVVFRTKTYSLNNDGYHVSECLNAKERLSMSQSKQFEQFNQIATMLTQEQDIKVKKYIHKFIKSMTPMFRVGDQLNSIDELHMIQYNNEIDCTYVPQKGVNKLIVIVDIHSVECQSFRECVQLVLQHNEPWIDKAEVIVLILNTTTTYQEISEGNWNQIRRFYQIINQTNGILQQFDISPHITQPYAIILDTDNIIRYKGYTKYINLEITIHNIVQQPVLQEQHIQLYLQQEPITQTIQQQTHMKNNIIKHMQTSIKQLLKDSNFSVYSHVSISSQCINPLRLENGSLEVDKTNEEYTQCTLNYKIAHGDQYVMNCFIKQLKLIVGEDLVIQRQETFNVTKFKIEQYRKVQDILNKENIIIDYGIVVNSIHKYSVKQSCFRAEIDCNVIIHTNTPEETTKLIHQIKTIMRCKEEFNNGNSQLHHAASEILEALQHQHPDYDKQFQVKCPLTADQVTLLVKLVYSYSQRFSEFVGADSIFDFQIVMSEKHYNKQIHYSQPIINVFAKPGIISKIQQQIIPEIYKIIPEKYIKFNQKVFNSKSDLDILGYLFQNVQKLIPIIYKITEYSYNDRQKCYNKITTYKQQCGLAIAQKQDESIMECNSTSLLACSDHKTKMIIKQIMSQLQSQTEIGKKYDEEILQICPFGWQNINQRSFGPKQGEITVVCYWCTQFTLNDLMKYEETIKCNAQWRNIAKFIGVIGNDKFHQEGTMSEEQFKQFTLYQGQLSNFHLENREIAIFNRQQVLVYCGKSSSLEKILRRMLQDKKQIDTILFHKHQLNETFDIGTDQFQVFKQKLKSMPDWLIGQRCHFARMKIKLTKVDKIIGAKAKQHYARYFPVLSYKTLNNDNINIMDFMNYINDGQLPIKINEEGCWNVQQFCDGLHQICNKFDIHITFTRIGDTEMRFAKGYKHVEEIKQHRIIINELKQSKVDQINSVIHEVQYLMGSTNYLPDSLDEIVLYLNISVIGQIRQQFSKIKTCNALQTKQHKTITHQSGQNQIIFYWIGQSYHYMNDIYKIAKQLKQNDDKYQCHVTLIILTEIQSIIEYLSQNERMYDCINFYYFPAYEKQQNLLGVDEKCNYIITQLVDRKSYCKFQMLSFLSDNFIEQIIGQLDRQSNESIGANNNDKFEELRQCMASKEILQQLNQLTDNGLISAGIRLVEYYNQQGQLINAQLPVLTFECSNKEVHQHLEQTITQLSTIIPNNKSILCCYTHQRLKKGISGQCTICQKEINDTMPLYYQPFKEQLICCTCAEQVDSKCLDPLIFFNNPTTSNNDWRYKYVGRISNNTAINNINQTQVSPVQCEGCFGQLEYPRYIALQNNEMFRYYYFCQTCFEILRNKQCKAASDIILQNSGCINQDTLYQRMLINDV